MYMNSIRNRLLELVKLGNPTFVQSLHPGIEHILGLKIPDIRILAKQLAADSNWKIILDNMDHYYMEERILHGMVIGYVKGITLEERLYEIGKFLPLINSWSVCDTFCSTLKFTIRHRSEVWEYIQSCFDSGEEYILRFAIVMSLNYYITLEYIDKIFCYMNNIHTDFYYVKMAQAWAVSVCYIKYPSITEEFLKDNQLDDFTQNKSIQKICESFRVDPRDKVRIKRYVRKV